MAKGDKAPRYDSAEKHVFTAFVKNGTAQAIARDLDNGSIGMSLILPGVLHYQGTDQQVMILTTYADMSLVVFMNTDARVIDWNYDDTSATVQESSDYEPYPIASTTQTHTYEIFVAPEHVFPVVQSLPHVIRYRVDLGSIDEQQILTVESDNEEIIMALDNETLIVTWQELDRFDQHVIGVKTPLATFTAYTLPEFTQATVERVIGNFVEVIPTHTPDDFDIIIFSVEMDRTREIEAWLHQDPAIDRWYPGNLSQGDASSKELHTTKAYRATCSTRIDALGVADGISRIQGVNNINVYGHDVLFYVSSIVTNKRRDQIIGLIRLDRHVKSVVNLDDESDASSVESADEDEESNPDVIEHFVDRIEYHQKQLDQQVYTFNDITDNPKMMTTLAEFIGNTDAYLRELWKMTDILGIRKQVRSLVTFTERGKPYSY